MEVRIIGRLRTIAGRGAPVGRINAAHLPIITRHSSKAAAHAFARD
ncbi:MAG: hypothetical protein ACI915_003953 [Gammaproteobacteria bacterium]|jgi:hypothetical protein